MVSDKYIEQRLQRMRVWMELRGLKPITVVVYLRCARLFMGQVRKPLRSVQQNDIEQYLLALVAKERHPQTRNVHLAGIRCLLRATVRRDVSAEIPQAKVPRRSPEILSGSEVTRLLEATTSLKYRAIFMLAYGAGLRVSELAALQTSDIDSQRMLIHVRTGKTGPRYVMMSPPLGDTIHAHRGTGDPAVATDRSKRCPGSARGRWHRFRFSQLHGQPAFRAAGALWRAPGFTAAVALVLAVGVGGSTAVFSVLRGVVLRPLGLPEPARLVRLPRAPRRPRGALALLGARLSRSGEGERRLRVGGRHPAGSADAHRPRIADAPSAPRA